MSKNLKYAVILFTICAICSLVLALANSITSPVIAANAEANRQAALLKLAMGNDVGDEQAVEGQGGIVSQMPLSKDGKKIGYLLTLKSNGYGGQFTMMASFKNNGEIMSASMLEDSETPGLGKKSEESWYMDKFIGTGSEGKPVPTAKSMLSKADSDAVSGASVTFGGVSKILAKGAQYVLSLGGAK